MPKLMKHQRVAIKVLKETGEPVTRIAARMGVDESTARYHLRRMAEGADDGCAKRTRIEAMGLADAATAWWAAQAAALPNGRSPRAEALHAWLQEEHGYVEQGHPRVA